jgi:hypothetical protein|nr:MAG TPA: hypothetical protein [Caudoviricetes sp.]
MNINSQNNDIILTFNEEEIRDVSIWLEIGFLNDLRDNDTDNIKWISKWANFILELDKVRHK